MIIYVAQTANRRPGIHVQPACRCDECEGIFNTEIELEYHKEAEGHWSDNDDDEDDNESDFDDDNGGLENAFVVYCEETESTEEELLL